MTDSIPLVNRQQSPPDGISARLSPEVFVRDPNLLRLIACCVSEDRRWDGDTLVNNDQLEHHFASTKPVFAHSSRVYMIKPQNSRRRLGITAEQCFNLLRHINAFAGANKMIESFATDETDFYIGRGGIHFGPSTLSNSVSEPNLEFSALLKFVERKPDGKWSIRQMGIYHAYLEHAQSETTLLVNPSELAWKALRTSLAGGTKTWHHWSLLPLLIFETLASEWSSYNRAMHQTVFHMHNNMAFLREPSEEDIVKGISSFRLVSIEEIKQISFFRDALKHAEHALSTNIETLQQYLKEAERRNGYRGSESRYAVLCFGLQGVIRELQFEKSQTQFILMRLERISASYQDVASTVNSDRMAEMTVKSVKEAHAVRIIALVTFCFLPPTFTCAFLQLNYIQFDDLSNGSFTVTANGAALLFWFLITAPILALTIGSWFVWDRRLRKRQLGLLQQTRGRDIV